MEKSVEWEFDTYMQEIFQMKEVDIREYSPLALAYIGDCIFDLVIKSLVMNEGNKQVQKMHKETSSYVQASAPVENDAYNAGTSEQKKSMPSIKEAAMPRVYRRRRTSRSQITDVRRDSKPCLVICI